jgi:hypothetical protein
MHDRIRFNILLLLGFVFTIKNLFIKLKMPGDKPPSIYFSLPGIK